MLGHTIQIKSLTTRLHFGVERELVFVAPWVYSTYVAFVIELAMVSLLLMLIPIVRAGPMERCWISDPLAYLPKTIVVILSSRTICIIAAIRLGKVACHSSLFALLTARLEIDVGSVVLRERDVYRVDIIVNQA